MNLSKDRLFPIVYESISNAFEGMAFLEVSPDVDDDISPNQEEIWLWAKVEIKQPLRGVFVLLYPKDIAQEIADAVCNSETEPLSEKQLLDLSGEIVNTSAGKFLCDLLPNDEKVKLGIPEVGYGWQSYKNAFSYRFQTPEERKIYVWLMLG